MTLRLYAPKKIGSLIMRLFNNLSLLLLAALLLISCRNSDDGSLALGTVDDLELDYEENVD